MQCELQGLISIYEVKLFCLFLSHYDIPNHSTSCHALRIFERLQWIWVNWLGFKHILGVLVGFQVFAIHFLNEALSQNMAHIDDLLLIRDAQVVLGILASCVTCQPSYFIRTLPPFSSLSFLVGLNRKVMQVCGDIMVLGSWESF